MRARVVVMTCALTIHAATRASADGGVGVPSPDSQVGPPHPVTHDDEPNDELAAFPLVVPHEKHWTRAGIEVGGVVILGFVDYLLNTGARGGLVREGDPRWALRYDWPELRAKLIGDAYELDANRLGTNYLAHPFAGSAYYQVARSNHLSFGESLLLSVAGSTIWEYFGEIRERVSVNDMLVTPLAGASIGEASMQLSGFFDRGRDQASNHVLAAVFSPIKKLNELVDGAAPRRAKATEVDPFGFALDPWHRFHIYSGAAITTQGQVARVGGTTPQQTYLDMKLGLSSEIVNLPGYRGAARHARLFDDGNISSLRFGGAVSAGDLVDALLETRVIPVGFYYREAAVDRHGRLVGQGVTVGLRMAFEWGLHDYDRDRLRARDQVSVVSPLGIEAEYVLDVATLSVRIGLSVGGSIAGVTPYALSDRGDVRPSRDGLPTVVKNQGYYHGLGVGSSPFVEVRYGPLVLEGRAKLETFYAIEGLDEANAQVDRARDLADQRGAARASLGWRPSWTSLRVDLGGEHVQRAGEVGAFRARRSETSLFSTLGVEL